MKTKIVFIVYFIFLFITIPSYKSYAASVTYSELVNKDVKYIIEDNNIFCVVSLTDDSKAFCLLISDTGVTNYSVQYKGTFNSANYFNNTIIISSTFSPAYVKTDTVLICAYDVTCGRDKTYAFDITDCEDADLITADNKNNGYAVSTKTDSKTVDVFSYVTNDFSKLEPNVGKIFSLYQDGSNIYFLGVNGLAVFDTNLHSFINNIPCSIPHKLAYVCDEVLLTENGDIYLFEDNTLTKVANCCYSGGSAFYNNGNLFYLNGNSLYAYNIYSECDYLAYDTDDIILDFAVSDEKIGILKQTSTGEINVDFIRFDKLNKQILDLVDEFLAESSSSYIGFSLDPDSESKDNAETYAPDNPPIEISDIISKSYTIDSVNKNIYNFSGEISVNNFKSLADDNLTVNIYRADMSEKTSGNLATGMKVLFTTSDGESDVYDAVVYGDVTGDGNINSNDLGTISEQILGEQTLDGVFYTAGDIDNSGNISCADWLKFMQLYN
ncbi:MAG: dockerin type I domain-containing protein [Acutalibacteraceae bacterium]